MLIICGIPLVSTSTGFRHKDIPEDCYVKIELDKVNDIEYLCEKIFEAYDNKKILTKKAREWYDCNCRFDDWEIKMKDFIERFYGEMYNKKTNINDHHTSNENLEL